VSRRSRLRALVSGLFGAGAEAFVRAGFVVGGSLQQVRR
jgi:hypothetical protein